jgi:NACalpha-BTF3-like transcription factor
MDVGSLEKMARFSRQMMVDFLKKNHFKTVISPLDTEIVSNAKKRFKSILEHIYEGEWLYFLNPITKSDTKPDVGKITTDDIIMIIEALDEPREQIYKALNQREGKLNEKIPDTDITPSNIYFWLIEHDAWHHGQMELLIETIDKRSIQPAIIFEDEQQ